MKKGFQPLQLRVKGLIRDVHSLSNEAHLINQRIMDEECYGPHCLDASLDVRDSFQKLENFLDLLRQIVIESELEAG